MDLLAGSGYSIINKSSLNLKWVTSLKINPSEAISFIKWAILQKSGIMRFSLDFVKTELLDEIHNVVEYLSPSVKLDLNLDKEISLRLIIAVAKQILERTKGILKGIQPLIGLKRIPLKAGIVSVRNTMDGFGQLLKPVLPLDELPDIGLNAEAIFGAENGLVAITHILDRLVKHSDIVPIDGLRALTPATATSIAGKMGGSIISGINGKIRFESKIFKLDNKSIPESKVFNDLVDFLAYSVGQPDLTKKYDEEIKTLLNVLKLQPIIFSILISYIENEDFEVGGFKIHGNNYLFLQSINENNAIHVGVQVLLKWMKSDESKINEFILKLVLTLIDKLDTPTGIYQLNQIGIDAMNINERGEIFRDNLSSEECSLIESDKDLYDKLIGINITSEIIRKISNALITTSSDLNLKDMLNNKSNQVNLEIEATLNVLSKVNSNVFKDYEYKAYLFYKSVTSITNLLEMDIEVLVNGDDDVDCEDSNEIGDSSEESDDVDNNSGSNENDDDGDDSGNSSKNDDGDGDGDDSSKNDDVDGLERSNIDDDDDDGNPSDDDDDDNGSGTDIGTTSTTVDNYNDGSGDNGDNNDDADNENSTSEIAEEPLKNIDANLTLIGINDLLIVRNRDKKVVFILDILFNIVILIEGDTKTVIVINLSLRSGFLVINKGLLNLEWVGLSSVNPTVVVSSIKSITLLKSGIKRFGLDSVNEEIINVLFNFAKILEPLVKEDLELDKELSVELIVSVFERILIYSTSTLKGLPKIIGVKEIHLPTGIPALANNIEGLAKLLELVAPLDELPDIGLNAEIIFGAENGLVTITHILERVIKHSDIVPIDGLRALTPASVTEISSLLGGQIVVESSGITRILSVIFQYRQGLVNESVVFNNFILYASYSMNQSNIKQEFNQDVTDFKNILVNYKEDIFADLIEYSENMNYTFKDIKIHSICQTLVNAITKDNVFEVILKALLNLEPAINHNRIVQTLLMTLIGKFFKPSGRYQLNNLDINVDKKIPVLTAEDNTLLKSEGNIYQILNDLSITKQIIKKVEKALETVSPDLDLEYVLTANSNPYIYGVLQYIFNIDLGVSDADMSFASSFVKSINNFFNFLEVDANDYYH